MINDYFTYRKNLEILENVSDSSKLIETLKNFLDTRNLSICAFVSNKISHWLASIQYSLKAEVGYAIWGDTGQNKGSDKETGIEFKGLIEKYKNSINSSLTSDGQLEENLIRPIFSVLVVKHDNNYYILGFGLLVSVEYDLYRNFKYWSEVGNIWKIRPKIKILYLDPAIRNNISKLSELDFTQTSEDELFKLIENTYRIPQSNKSEESLAITTNQCYEENTRKGSPSKPFILFYNFIKSKIEDEKEVLETLSIYRSLSSVATLGESVVIKPHDVSCKRSQDLQIPEGLITSLSFDHNKLKEILVSIIKSGNLLFVGPPGTGKTELAINLAKYVSGENCFMLTTANSLWFRRDVIGGETLINGNVAWKSGIFIKAYNKAYESDSEFFAVIIDEINRADVDKAFGELFTVFSSSDPENWLIPNNLLDEICSYSNRDKEAEKFLEYYSKAKDKPLKKIRIIGTMNLMDMRNLFSIGEALVRRFSIVNFEYPRGSEDVTDTKDDKIKEFISCLREKFNQDRSGLLFNISPASVRKTLSIYTQLKPEEKDLQTFSDILRGNLGTLNVKILEKYDEFSSQCLERMGVSK
ncbi:AAA family ATPase [Acidianus manzaensis]|uniref:AAA+ ATPase domain-containing protein n=1 Tax=Acidianus manzaensis TaxID=282676 RepID=A0A1W6K2W6_9CREN|nr:AAA family ATPase [Acidianus manzaensis]ARM76840.1 hypothetical protein B6F84_12975 [Acidianus manzaensis]